MNERILDIMKTNKLVHNRVVEGVIEARKPNRALGAAAPDVDNVAQRKIFKQKRTTLARPHTAFCSALNGYLHDISAAKSPLCPCYRQDEHTVQHLFQCTEHPPICTAIEMWYFLASNLEFLRSWPRQKRSFNR